MNRLLFLYLFACLAVAGAVNFEFSAVDTTITAKGETKTTYLSSPLPLQPGWCIQSDPFDTPMPMPKSGFIRGFFAEVVDSNNKSVPLYEVYLHHWVFFSTSDIQGPCASLGFAVGVGAETRGTPIIFPEGYAVKIDPTADWYASIHVLRTTHVENVKHCIECHCPGGPGQGGGIQCCPTTQMTNVSCPLVPKAPEDTKTYFLKYEITWVPDTTEIVPVAMLELDVTKCSFQYNVRQCADPTKGPCIDKQENSYVSTMEGDVVFLYGHMHIGGINVTLHVNDQLIYNALPKYGTGTEPGNEKDYLVAISTLELDPPFKLKKGDTMRVTAHYHNDVYHDGVMGLLLLAYHNTENPEDTGEVKLPIKMM